MAGRSFLGTARMPPLVNFFTGEGMGISLLMELLFILLVIVKGDGFDCVFAVLREAEFENHCTVYESTSPNSR